ncbi:hypothetical protein SUGI_0544500 [Cryptomeria japonica]|nr:hypothetical protein SUGI_0544500 [Cryptomeria japonica]
MSILKTYFQPEVFLPTNSKDDWEESENEGSEDSNNSERIRVKSRRLEKEEEREKMRTFGENAWEVFRCAVQNGNMVPFRRITNLEEWWFSDGATETVINVGEFAGDIMQTFNGMHVEQCGHRQGNNLVEPWQRGKDSMVLECRGDHVAICFWSIVQFDKVKARVPWSCYFEILEDRRRQGRSSNTKAISRLLQPYQSSRFGLLISFNPVGNELYIEIIALREERTVPTLLVVDNAMLLACHRKWQRILRSKVFGCIDLHDATLQGHHEHSM